MHPQLNKKISSILAMSLKSTLISVSSFPVRLIDTSFEFSLNKFSSMQETLLCFPSNDLKLLSGEKTRFENIVKKLCLIVSSSKLIRSMKASLGMLVISVPSMFSTTSFDILTKLLRLMAFKGVSRTSNSNRFGKNSANPFGRYEDHH